VTETTTSGPTIEQRTTTGAMSGGRMQAIVQSKYGTADVLAVAEIDRPVIDDDEVLVQVRAAGLDRGTWHLMAGLPYAARLVAGLRAPKNSVPGLDVAGVVVAVGSEVTRFQPGDEVFGVGKGSFAEFAAAREDKLALKPSNLTFEQAAAVPVSGMTALRGLSDVGRLQAGQKVLIIGASGGVGSYAVQIVKALGAEVTGVCSTSKLDLVRSIGADHVIDYTRDDFANGDKQYDLILDVGGNAALSRLRRALTPHGTLVIVGGEGGGNWIGMGRQLRALALSPFVGQRLTMLGPKEHYTVLERLTELIEGGKLVPAIEQTYALSEMPNAMRHLEAGRARGKLVIAVSSM
jgi:NADPH:quinone reductase-like Zn-dependent oxidoreductase